MTMPNRLASASSPYLQQHKDNPVDWYPWGPEALQKSKTENKPIFLSIGYSSCHWCHVMERESFSNLGIAEVLNKLFIPIKVDREERPDLDHLYMQSVIMMTGAGGWPLNVFLTPDLRPYFGGTYFAPDARYGRPPFGELLIKLSALFHEQPAEVKKNADQLTAMLVQQGRYFQPREKIDPLIISKILLNASNNHDSKFGGLGQAPKFFYVDAHRLMLMKGREIQNPELIAKVETTLKHISYGGVYDQVGGGFHRYSTDAEWKIPHYEKMLYDNALLSVLFTEAYQATQNSLYQEIAIETLEWVLREMQSPDGGFYSAIDADSEHEEGIFYSWDLKELKKNLPSEIFDRLPMFTEAFESKRIFHFSSAVSNEDRLEIKAHLKNLLAIRGQRVWPLIDRKILTSWNGLMISALSKAAKVFDRKDFEEAAIRAVNYIWTKGHREKNLAHCFFEGQASEETFLEDYAYFAEGLLDLFELTKDAKFLERAQILADELLEIFEDKKDAGFWSTPATATDLLMRSKEIADGALPAPYSVALALLSRLEMKEPFERSLKAILGNVEEGPGGFNRLALVLDRAIKNQSPPACVDDSCVAPSN